MDANVNMTAGSTPTGDTQWQLWGNKQYELSNHLGNVLATITDRRIQVANTGTTPATLGHLEADVASAQDYYAFGMQQPGRNGSLVYNATTQQYSWQAGAGNYRYGFNGKENDNDVGKGIGNEQDYGMRIYDPRLGRFLSVDPITAKYPELTPYQFASNSPIQYIDQDGKEGMGVTGTVIQAIAIAHSNKSNPSFIDYVSALGDLADDFANDVGSSIKSSLKSSVYTYSGAGLMDHVKEYGKNEVDNIVNAGNRYEAAVKSGDNPNDVTMQYKYNKTVATLSLVKDGIDFFGLSATGADFAYTGIMMTGTVVKNGAISEAESILNGALKRQGFKEGDVIPSNFKSKFVDNNGIEFEVRIHPADPKYGGGDIYRVARRTENGSGWEYLDPKGKWHSTKDLKPQNPTYNPGAAKDTHISKPQKRS